MRPAHAAPEAAHYRGADRIVALTRRPPIIPMAITVGWLIAVIAQATGNATLLHHHALIEGGPPLWVAVPLFLLSWQVMIVAMMLPASVRSISACSSGTGVLGRPRRSLVTFLGAYALVWTTFGLLAFLGDFVFHQIVDVTPWLSARPWLIEAGVLTLAGVYQLTPLKRRSLEACRSPTHLLSTTAAPHRGSLELGLNHSFDCLVSSWALMLLMFAQGFANLWWMVALTTIMVYETTGTHGQRAARLVGVPLLFLAAVVAFIPWARV
jgi:predicted metal-binding membrane protein